MQQIIGVIVAVLINCALVLFVIGLILGPHGARARRTAGALFVLAFAPSIVFGLLHAAGMSLTAVARANPIGTIVVLAGIAFGAYVALLQLKKSPDGRTSRIQMKRPYTHRRDTDVISMLREQLGGRNDEP